MLELIAGKNLKKTLARDRLDGSFKLHVAERRWRRPSPASPTKPGRPDRATEAGDIYSLGLLLQELFTDRPPYRFSRRD